MHRAKNRITGNVKFVAKLLINRLIATRVLITIVEELKQRHDDLGYELLKELLEVFSVFFAIDFVIFVHFAFKFWVTKIAGQARKSRDSRPLQK